MNFEYLKILSFRGLFMFNSLLFMVRLVRTVCLMSKHDKLCINVVFQLGI